MFKSILILLAIIVYSYFITYLYYILLKKAESDVVRILLFFAWGAICMVPSLYNIAVIIVSLGFNSLIHQILAISIWGSACLLSYWKSGYRGLTPEQKAKSPLWNKDLQNKK